MQSHSAKHGAGRQRPGSESLPARSEGAPKVVGFAAAWCAGTLAAHQLPAPLTAGWYVVAALLVLLALGLPRGRWLIGLVAAFVWTAQTVESRLADRLPGDLSGRDFRVSGWIDGFPRGTAARMTFSLRVVAADDERVPRRLRLSWYRPLVGLEPGTGLSVVVRLRPPRGFANPGGFDYERWALVAGYGATGYVRSGQADADRPAALGRRWLRVRSALAARIAAAAPSENASALLTALALGERFRFSDEHWRVLRRTGTSHLVAISGLHIGLVAALTFMLTRRLWLRLPVA